MRAAALIVAASLLAPPGGALAAGAPVVRVRSVPRLTGSATAAGAAARVAPSGVRLAPVALQPAFAVRPTVAPGAVPAAARTPVAPTAAASAADPIPSRVAPVAASAAQVTGAASAARASAAPADPRSPAARLRATFRGLGALAVPAAGRSRAFFDRGVARPFSSRVAPRGEIGSPWGSRNAAEAAGPSAGADFQSAHGRESGLQAQPTIEELRELLGDGTLTESGRVRPFGFRNPDGSFTHAYAAGLEGFLYGKLAHEQRHGEAHSAAQAADYFSYLDALLAPAPFALQARRELRSIARLAVDDAKKNALLNAALLRITLELRGKLAEREPALWGRDASIYMILARAYNTPKPGQTFFDAIDDAELDRIARETRANTLWLLDIFEIGEVRRWGSGGGSPYAIKGYGVKAELGGPEAFKRFVARAHAKGFRVMTDYIPNHTALDGAMLRERPEAFVHLVPPQPAPGEDLEAYKSRILAEVPRTPHGERMYWLTETESYPEDGGRVRKWILVHHPYQGGGYSFLWRDMAQIDYSHPAAREYRLAEARRLFAELGIDGARRDMSYLVLNGKFFRHWLGTLRWERERGSGWVKAELERAIAGMEARERERGGAEYLAEYARAVREARADAFAIDEAYEEFEQLGRVGSHARYNKLGLFEALESRDPERARAALREVAFRVWQLGSAGLANYPISHDADDGHGHRGYALDRYGRHHDAVLALSLSFRPHLIYNGLEQGLGQRELLVSDRFHESQDLGKPIPFDIPVKIDWRRADPARKAFIRTLLEFGESIQELLQRGAMSVLDPYGATPVVAFSAGLKKDGGQRAALVAANLGDGEAWGHFHMDRSGPRALGAFQPERGKRYRLIDRAARRADGSYENYEYSGEELRERGLFVKLAPGGVHLFEIEELEPAPSARPSSASFIKDAVRRVAAYLGFR